MLVFDGFCDRIECLEVCLYLYAVCILWYSTWSTELIHFQLISKVCFLSFFLLACRCLECQSTSSHENKHWARDIACLFVFYTVEKWCQQEGFRKSSFFLLNFEKNRAVFGIYFCFHRKKTLNYSTKHKKNEYLFTLSQWIVVLFAQNNTRKIVENFFRLRFLAMHNFHSGEECIVDCCRVVT